MGSEAAPVFTPLEQPTELVNALPLTPDDCEIFSQYSRYHSTADAVQRLA